MLFNANCIDLSILWRLKHSTLQYLNDLNKQHCFNASFEWQFEQGRSSGLRGTFVLFAYQIVSSAESVPHWRQSRRLTSSKSRLSVFWNFNEPVKPENSPTETTSTAQWQFPINIHCQYSNKPRWHICAYQLSIIHWDQLEENIQSKESEQNRIPSRAL